MKTYDPKHENVVTCPKCGRTGNVSVRYEKDYYWNWPMSSEPPVLIRPEHLQGWCGNCQYDGPEYRFEVVK